MPKLIFPLFFSLALIFSCSKEEGVGAIDPDPNPSINKILPLGASRVEGARPVFESFRYELWKDLVDGQWTFDFIGTMEDDASYPMHDGASFDADHEGRSGWTSGEIRSGIDDWLRRTGAPDIVLFSSPGGNDALQELSYDDAVANINAIIDALQTSNPAVTIVIEQMAPARSQEMTPQLTAYFMQLQQDVVDIATAQTTATSRVVTVDMFTGFSDDLLADDVHYNEAGASFIADQYYQVLKTFLEE